MQGIVSICNNDSLNLTLEICNNNKHQKLNVYTYWVKIYSSHLDSLFLLCFQHMILKMDNKQFRINIIYINCQHPTGPFEGFELLLSICMDDCSLVEYSMPILIAQVLYILHIVYGILQGSNPGPPAYAACIQVH